MNKKYSIFMLLAMLVAVAFSSCSSNNDEPTSSSSTVVSNSYTSTLVSNFQIGANSKVLYNLDSVFFCIDQDKNLIYNADSLPKGTDVSHLTVNVTFPSAVGKALFKVKDSKWMTEKTIEYKSATTDSIDFSSPVELEVTSQDNKMVRTYTVKVNVHQMEPDSLYWDQRARRDLPNTSGFAKAQKTVAQGDNYFCLVADTYGYVLSKAANPGQGTWEKKVVAFDFTPEIETFTASTDALYILSTAGTLYKSTDEGTTWTDCGVAWYSIKGAYGGKVLGVYVDGREYKHDEYPRAEGFVPKAVDANFPVVGSTEMVMASNTWTDAQQAMLACGVNKDGELVNSVWGYDGKRWGRIDDEHAGTQLPQLKGAAMVSYASFNNDSITHRLTKRATWLVMGGRKADGSMNRTTYVSYNQGITWSSGGTKLQLPQYLPSFVNAQAFVIDETLGKARAKAPIQPITEWQCPYIFLVGGMNDRGELLGSIWKGVINQLTFKPIY
ncbi:MAG: DUF6242 domain-containing protein [Bacteroidales bacterium]|nr:DUF6242 domain-containing protein [Bacteroidales bacterium]